MKRSKHNKVADDASMAPQPDDNKLDKKAASPTTDNSPKDGDIAAPSPLDKGLPAVETSGSSSAQDGKKQDKPKAPDYRPDAGMIKNAMKNFGKNLIYSFVPMGIVYLFILFAILLLISNTANNIADSFKQLVEVVGGSIEASSASIEEFLKYAFGRINWNGNFFDTLSTIIDLKWISETIKGFFETLSLSTENFDEQITGVISQATVRLVGDISMAISIGGVGIWLANFSTRHILRVRTAKRNLKKKIIALVVVPIVESIMVIFATILIALIRWFAILVLFALIALWAVVSLMNSYFIHRDKSVDIRLKDIITVKNVASHLIVCAIILAIDIVMFIALWFIHPLLAVLIMLPFLIYSLNVIDVNTDSFVLDMVTKAKLTAAASESEAPSQDDAEPQPADVNQQASKQEAN